MDFLNVCVFVEDMGFEEFEMVERMFFCMGFLVLWIE